MLSGMMLSGITLSFIMLSDIMLSVIMANMLSGVILNVIMSHVECHYTGDRNAKCGCTECRSEEYRVESGIFKSKPSYFTKLQKS